MKAKRKSINNWFSKTLSQMKLLFAGTYTVSHLEIFSLLICLPNLQIMISQM